MNMSSYSLSTSWNSPSCTSGFDIIKQIKAMGFDTVELDWALEKKTVDEILSMKDAGEIRISSLHNVCPLPGGVTPDKATPDYYCLSSPDEEERGMAVKAACNTIDYAKRSGARAVVLHMGRVYINEHMKELASLIRKKERFEELRGEMIKERLKNRAGFLDNVMRSLEELVPYALKTGVCLGVENRYYYREIPLMDEFEAIFAKFKAGTLYYWHDVGHAEVFDRLGLARHKDLLDKFANRLIGVHLHDIIGLTDDHNAPGAGTADFGMLKPYIGQDTIRVLEVHGQATAKQVCDGVKLLKGIFDS